VSLEKANGGKFSILETSEFLTQKRKKDSFGEFLRTGKVRTKISAKIAMNKITELVGER
jgi:hypothetical protein